MHSLARFITSVVRLLRTLIGSDVSGEEPAVDRRRAHGSVGKARMWEQIAAGLGWIPPRLKRAPAYARRAQPDSPQLPDRH